MRNKAMGRKIEEGECVDLSACAVKDGCYVITPDFVPVQRIENEGLDFCNAKTEQWIWSIGQDLQTGEVLASHDARFYQNPEYKCLWLR